MLININASSINTTSTAADVQTVTKIQDLSDVHIPNGLDTGQIMTYNALTSNWENTDTIDGALTINQNLTVAGETIPYTLRANPDTDNRFTFRTTWENYGTDEYDLSTSLRTYQQPGAGQLAVHQWFTQNNNFWYKFEAMDNGGGDIGDHSTRLVFQGDTGVIRSQSQGGGGKPLTIQHSDIRLESLYPGNEHTVKMGNWSAPGSGILGTVFFTSDNDYKIVGIQQIDNGGGDDGSAITRLNLHSNEVNTIASLDHGYGPAPLNIEGSGLHLVSFANDLTLATDNGSSLEMNAAVSLQNAEGSRIELSNQPKIFTRKDHDVANSEISLYRKNNTGADVVESGSQLALNFNMLSEDNSTEKNVGQFQVIYDDGGNGNAYKVIVNETTGPQANAIEIYEKYTRSQQPFAYPTFTQTEINAMSPSNGWVLYNISTETLQVYAAGSWVDLH